MARACVHHEGLRQGGFLGRVFAATGRMEWLDMAQSTGRVFSAANGDRMRTRRGGDIETEIRVETRCEQC